MLHMVLETTIIMAVLYLVGWLLGMNFRTLGYNGYRAALEARQTAQAKKAGSGDA